MLLITGYIMSWDNENKEVWQYIYANMLHSSMYMSSIWQSTLNKLQPSSWIQTGLEQIQFRVPDLCPSCYKEHFAPVDTSMGSQMDWCNW